jgi:hypothetical protein
MTQARWLVAVDIGGTFTDAVAFGPNGNFLVAKVLSTPQDPAVAFANALTELIACGLELEATDLIFHGTTIATNAMLNDRLARVALLTTEGFRDVLSYRSGTRPLVYDLEQRRPLELVPRRDRMEVRERLSSAGDILVPSPRTKLDAQSTPSRREIPKLSPFHSSSATSTTSTNEQLPRRSPHASRTCPSPALPPWPENSASTREPPPRS